MRIIIYAYLVLTFACGIVYTRYSLARDVEYAVLDSGRVNLLRSYWYELWYPREVLQWWASTANAPLTPDVMDKAAILIYGRLYGVKFGMAGTDTMYVLTAYPTRLREFKVERLFPKAGFWNIYRVTKKGK